MTDQSTRPDLVLVLHGLGNTSLIMAPLSNFLKRANFDVLNVGYPSVRHSSSALQSMVAQALLLRIKQNNPKHVGIVGFSLGGLLGRLLIENLCSQVNFSRLVMLGPPNAGSSIARFLKNYLPTAKIWGPVFEELCAHDFHNPCQNVRTGIIAGGLGKKMGINPFFGEDNDGLVTVKETHLDGAHEHKVLLAIHGTMPLQPRVMKLTSRFLDRGSFA